MENEQDGLLAEALIAEALLGTPVPEPEMTDEQARQAVRQGLQTMQDILATNSEVRDNPKSWETVEYLKRILEEMGG